MALGSCNEVIVLLKLARDLQYVTGKEGLEEQYDILGKQLYKLIVAWK